MNYIAFQVDWVPNGKHKKNDTGEIVNEKAVETLRSIEDRLDGLVEPAFKSKRAAAKPAFAIPLSPPGQVQHLIKEATSHEHLSQMFHGWAPYL